MKCYVKSCIADFGADAKSSIKCNTLIMEIKITQQLHSLPRCRVLDKIEVGEKEKLTILLSPRKVREENNPLSFLMML